MAETRTGLGVCAAHGVETRLRCAECARPICLRCQVRTPVGLKCERCASQPAAAVRRRRRGSSMVMVAGASVLIVVAAAAAGLALRGSSRPAPGHPPPPGRWDPAPDAPGIRGATNGVALRDGSVLVAGGGVGSIPLSGTAIFDPGPDRWTAAGALREARRGNAMVLLADGRVMVAGGIAGQTLLASVELYDPATRAWIPAAPMRLARLSPLLALLGDGRVLAAGGLVLSAGAIVASPAAEVFDPRTGAWSPLPAMLGARSEAAATPLRDGRVLIEGGLSGGGTDTTALETAELFDPVVGVFTRTGNLKAPRHGHSAIMLADGRVLVAGGTGATSNVLVTEVFDPGTGSWSPSGALATGRHLPAAALLADGRVMIAGGESALNASRASLRSAELFSPATGRWSRAADMSCPRSNLALVSIGTVAIAIGGDAAFPGEPPRAQSCTEIFRAQK